MSRSRGARAAYVERLGSTLANMGFPRLPARVFAALLTEEDGRMTSAEVVAALRVSPASVSSSVTYLQTIHLIHREREPGSRRDVYVVAQDAWHDVMINNSSVYGVLRSVLAQGIPLVGDDTAAGERLNLSVEFLAFMETEILQIARRWEVRRESLTRGRPGPAPGAGEASGDGVQQVAAAPSSAGRR